MIGVCWGFVALLFLSAEGRLDAARHAVKTIGTDAAPSIVAAQGIGLALVQLDANVANTLLGSAAHRATARVTIERECAEFTKTLVDAAQNITYGDAEKAPILALFSNFGRYLELASEARVLFENAQIESGSARETDVKGALAAYAKATDLLHRELLPAADALDKANRAFFDRAYREEQDASTTARFFAIVLGFALVGSLVYTQLFLYRHMRRLANPALVLATLVSVGYTVYLSARFQESKENTRTAVADAFESVHALVKARVIAADANGEESRWLLEPSREREDAFRSKVKLLTTKPESSPPATGSSVDFEGLFADELKNITFAGEREAAVEMTRQFTAYYRIDGVIRRLFAEGKRDAAIELCIGDRPDESNAAFDRFDQAIVKVIAINRVEFDRTIDAETQAAKAAETIAPFCAIAIAALVFLGLRARLREYHA